MSERRQCGGQLTLPSPQRGLTSWTTGPESRGRLDPTQRSQSAVEQRRPEAAVAKVISASLRRVIPRATATRGMI